MNNFSKKQTTGNTVQMSQTTNQHCCGNTDNRKISEAAYFLAEKNGFQGNQVDYWLEAERQLKNQTTTKKR